MGRESFKPWLLLLPQERRESSRELIAAMETKVSAYIAGQGVLMLVVGVMAFIAYWLIGLPYVLVLAFVAGVMEAVPLVGPLLGAIPAALVALTLGPDKLIWVIVATVVIQQLENSFLVPRIMRQAVGVNPFVTLLALFAFSSLLDLPALLWRFRWRPLSSSCWIVSSFTQAPPNRRFRPAATMPAGCVMKRKT
jgi:predicted PurR-regulated permease PerM